MKKLRTVKVLLLCILVIGLLSACEPGDPPITLPTLPTTPGTIVTTTIPDSKSYDLQTYYPNTSIYKTQYLEGTSNLNSSQGFRQVLWFEWQDQGTYKMYNSAPGAAHYGSGPNTSRCNYDVLSWWNINGDITLRYSKTHNECSGVVKETIYDPPIIFLPGSYNTAKPWSLDYSSTAKHYIDGKLSCVGVNNYKAQIHGQQTEKIPNSNNFEKNLHWSTTQKTTWNPGTYEINSLCSSGGVTNWKENYVLSDNISINGQLGKSNKGLRRTYGGNADGVHDQWDITFNSWNVLPED